MIYQFITDQDINAQIRSDMLKIVIDNDSRILKTGEKTAIIQIKSKIQNRYDVESVFPMIVNWTAAKAFTIGNYTYHNEKFYKAITAGTNKIPANSPLDWVEEDPRNQLLVMYCIDIALYHIHSRINPNKIPQLRIDRYDEALEWLDGVRKGDESPDLPLPEDDSDGSAGEVRWGSLDPIDHDW